MTIVSILADEYFHKSSVDGSKWLLSRVQRNLENDNIINLNFNRIEKYNREEFQQFVEKLQQLPRYGERVAFLNMSRNMKRHLDQIIPVE